MEEETKLKTVAEFRNKLVGISKEPELFQFLDSNQILFPDKLKIMCLISHLSPAEMQESLARRGFQVQKNNEIIHASKTSKKGDEDVTINFLMTIDERRNLGKIISFADSKGILLIEQLVSWLPKTYFLWIRPVSMERCKNKILTDYPDSRITHFFAKRFLHYKLQCDIRPDIERSMEYRGIDGKEALAELKKAYGVFPQSVSFDVPDIGSQFKIKNNGLFAFRRGSLTYLLSLIDFAHNELLLTKKAVEQSYTRLALTTRRYGSVTVPEINPLTISLSKTITAEDSINIITEITKEKSYAVVDDLIIEGSLYFSLTLFDRLKQTYFAATSDGKTITVTPKPDTNFDSLLRFCEFITEKIDTEAEVSSEQNDVI